MGAVHIGVGHDDHLVVACLFEGALVGVADAGANGRDECADFSFERTLSRRAFSVLISFPRRGRIAWGAVSTLLCGAAGRVALYDV